MATLLSTKKLSLSQQSLLLNADISFVEYNAIKIQQKEKIVPKRIDNLIVTSKNALKVLSSESVINQAFCVGKKTRQVLEKQHISVVETAENAESLAKIIAKNYADKKFVFLCGNKRKDDLPRYLSVNRIVFTEIEVYKTLLMPKKFHRSFDGVLFFSPSAVQSFFKQNTIRTNSPAFCIGSTTAKEARNYTDNVYTATYPSIENVIIQVVKFFRRKET